MTELEATLRNGIKSLILVWKTWNLHGFVLLSLFLQIILFSTGPLRKKTTTGIVVMLIWCAYQLAGTAINRALTTLYSDENVQPIYTLWAVFMLLHFGGPDTITALSMEDNDLWSRNWINLVTQLVATANVVLTVYSENLKSKPYILVSSLLILLAGLVKSFERIQCLKKGSLELFRNSIVQRKPNPGPDYATIVEEHNIYKNAAMPVQFVEVEEPEVPFATPSARKLEDLTDAQLVKHAYRFFNKFKGTYVDMAFCCHDRMETRDIFLCLSPQAALTVLETEMKFAFEAFYTKAHLFANPKWKWARFFSFVLEVAALLLWFCQTHRFPDADALVTTCLFVGAVFIDIIAYARLCRSDWRIAQSAPNSSSQTPSHVMRRRRWGECPQITLLFHKLMRILFRQWSESISQFNFINYCLAERPKCLNTLYTCLGAKDMMDGWDYVSSRRLTNHLTDFIFEELKNRSSLAENLDRWEDVNSSRGSWTLRYNASKDLDPATFEPWILDVEYDESLMMWHIATELCYHTEKTPEERKEKEHRTFSKILSDYVGYLSVRKSELISEVAPMTGLIFNDTCEEARKLFHRVMASSLANAKDKKVHKEACERIKQVTTTEIPPGYIKEEENNSVLFDASELAKKLMSVERGRWKLISQIWVELLCYAAANSPGSAHAKLLCQGGELVTLVRLLMLHLGLSNAFHKAKRVPRKVLVPG